jgi:hypothetical protein
MEALSCLAFREQSPSPPKKNGELFPFCGNVDDNNDNDDDDDNKNNNNSDR